MESTTYLTTAEIARDMRVSRSTVLTWIASGVLPAIRLPGNERQHFRIHVSDYREFKLSLGVNLRE